MPVRVVIGAQWGDEGKGKIVDLLSAQTHIVARYQGGANAGHTIWHNQTKYVLRLVPSGILHAGVFCILGNGVVIDPVALFEELQGLREVGIDVDGRVMISPHAHIIFPYHKLFDQAKEKYLGENQVGTTQRGIGPAYLDKIDRSGIRAIDLLDAATLRPKLEKKLDEKNKLLMTFGADPIPVAETVANYIGIGERLRPLVGDTVQYLYQAIRSDRDILLEGAQGTLLDIDHGTYPFVTSSNASSGGACTGLGMGPLFIDHVMGVAKAYTTRVGNGPFPTEFDDDMGKKVRELGGEYGAVTGRPRRCGWLDMVMLKYAVMVNGIDELAITKLDVLDSLPEIGLCTEYQLDGKPLDLVTADAGVLQRVKPVYRFLAGWQSDTSTARTMSDLPPKAAAYLDFIEKTLDVHVRIVSVGQERDRTIQR